MAALLFLPLAPCLGWLLFAAWRYPVPLSYNWRSLWQRKASTLSTAASIAVVVAIFVVVLSLSQGISRAFVSSGRSDQVLVLRPNARVELNSTVERAQARILKIDPLVARDAAGPLVSAECYVVLMLDRIDGGGGTNLALRGLEPAGVRMRSQVRLVQGRWFNPDLSELVIPRKLAERFQGLALGRSLRYSGRDWPIVGVFEAQGSAYDSEIWTDVEQLMQARKRNVYSSVLARLADPARIPDFIRAVDADKRLKLEAKTELDYYAEQTEAGKPIRVLGNLITVILTVGAIFAAMNTMYSTVAGRTAEIGTLRALGFRRVEILASFQWEALMLCALGGLAGALLALGFNGIRTSTANFQTFSDVSFAFTITPGLMAQGVAFSILMGLAGGFLPAWRASRIPVTEAMKG
jgi:ABC-type lipoprotein release transport system permease subunit